MTARTPKITLPKSGKLSDLIGKKVVNQSGNHGQIVSVAVDDGPYPLIARMYSYDEDRWDGRWYEASYTKDGYERLYHDDNFITLVKKNNKKQSKNSDLPISELDRQIKYARTTKITESNMRNLLGKEVRCSNEWVGTVVLIDPSCLYPITVEFPKKCIRFNEDGFNDFEKKYIKLINVEKPENDSDLAISELDRQIEWIMHTTGVTRNRAIKSIMGE
jgi:hypothetical protein